MREIVSPVRRADVTRALRAPLHLRRRRPSGGGRAVDAVLRGRARPQPIRAHYDDMLRTAASLKRGWVPASLLITRLKNVTPQSPLAAALGEYDRIVRTNHYRLDMKAWIPHDAVVDPEQPITLPYLLASRIHRPCHTPSLLPRGATLVSTRYEGDKHDGFDGSFRVQSSLEFDWDGTNISNSVPRGQFGTTRLTATYRNFLNTNCCELASRTATQAASASGSGSSFALHYSAANPLPRVPSPAISGDMAGTTAADGTVRFHYRTDLFPSHGVRVSKNGTPQRSDIVNEASCLPNFFVTGRLGVVVVVPDGNLRFTEFAATRSAGISPRGVVKEFTLPRRGRGPAAIATDSGGVLWITEVGPAGNRIARIAAP